MLLVSLHLWALALPLLVHGSLFGPKSTRSTDQTTSDPIALVDDFLQHWKEKHPGLESNELQRIQASADTVKAALLNPNQNSNGTVRRDTGIDPPRYSMKPRQQTKSSASSGNFTIQQARAIVRQAQLEANAINRERFQNPRLNNYYASFGKHEALRARAADAASITPSEEVKSAAALVAEADAQNQTKPTYPNLSAQWQRLVTSSQPDLSNDTGTLSKRAGSSWWMEGVAHEGKVPYGGDSSYVVFRNVKDYGAVGDGKTDDTAAINKAMSTGNRCGNNCGASTIKPAILYFPSGTYLISSSISAYYMTQMIGNANDPPIIKAAASFVGLGVISSDVYTGGNGGTDEWYINQNNFFRQLRNFVIDVRDATLTDIAGVHWQVAQATSIQNVVFYQSDATGKQHRGLFAENGSGGFMSDVLFNGGSIGMSCGNQQFTVRNFEFSGCRTGINLLWDWGWTWKSLNFRNVDTAIRVNGTDTGGSLILLDSSISDSTTGIQVTTPSKGSEQFKVTIDNLELINVKTAVTHKSAGITLAGGSRVIDSWTYGTVYDEAHPKGILSADRLSAVHPDDGLLMGVNGYYERSKPQYEHLDANTFFNAHLAAKGDGVSDDTFGLALMISIATSLARPLYIPFGSYIVTSTVRIPKGAIIVGECWAQIVAKGAYFSDAANPQVMVQVGEIGDVGSMEIQDVLFTVEGPTAGSTLR